MTTLKTVARLLSAVSLLAVAVPGVRAQHTHEASMYAGTQSAETPSLTQAEIDGLRAGEGMGLARPAELNHFPGPKHVLDLAGELRLSSQQAARVEAIREAMTNAAVAKGEEILTVAHRLDDAFGSGSITPAALNRMTGHLATLRGELQAIHLLAHLETRAALTPAQIARYDELRGYVTGG